MEMQRVTADGEVLAVPQRPAPGAAAQRAPIDPVLRALLQDCQAHVTRTPRPDPLPLDGSDGEAVVRWRTVALRRRRLGHHAWVWDALLQRLWGGHPMLRSLFIETLLQHFGRGSERLCIGYDANGTVQALCLLTRVGPGTWQTFQPSQLQIAPVLMRNADALPQLMRALPQPTWRVQILDHDVRWGRLMATAPRRHGAHWHALTTFIAHWHALTTFIELQGGFEAYLRQRSSKLQSNLRRYEARLQRHGEVRLVSFTGPAEMPAAVARYAAIEQQGWKGEAGTALDERNGQSAFYTALMEAAARRGGAEVHELHVNGEVVASRMALVDARLVVMLKTTYLERYADCAPGNLLLARVIERCFGHHGGKRIEFCTNANPDQQAWATGTSNIVHVEHPRWNWLGQCMALARSGAGLWHSRTAAHDVGAVRHCESVEQLPWEMHKLLPAAAPLATTPWHFWLLQGRSAPLALLPYAHQAPAAARARRPGDSLLLLAPVLAHRAGQAQLELVIHALLKALPRTAHLAVQPMDPTSREFSTLREALRGAGLFVFKHRRPDCGHPCCTDAVAAQVPWGLVAYNPRTLAGLRGLLHEALGRAAWRLLPWRPALAPSSNPSSDSPWPPCP